MVAAVNWILCWASLGLFAGLALELLQRISGTKRTKCDLGVPTIVCLIFGPLVLPNALVTYLLFFSDTKGFAATMGSPQKHGNDY